MSQKQRQRISHAVHVDAVYMLYAVMMAGIVAVCLVLPGIAYAKKWNLVSNWILLPVAAAACILLLPVMGRAGRAAGKMKRSLLLTMSFAALFVQIFIARSYYFHTDWDVETIVECALSMIDGRDISWHGNYFSMYPNNLVLVTLFGWIARAAALLGMQEHAYFALIVFQCLISWGTGVMTCCLIHRLTKSDFASAFGCLLYMVLVGFSPWVTIPYSDSVALLFPAAILCVTLMMPRSGFAGGLRLFLLAFLSYFGYRIKPQVVIVLIAIVLMWLGRLLFPADTQPRRPVFSGGKLLSAGTGLLCAVLLCNGMAAAVKVPIDKNKQMGIAHYLMMGLNEEEFGAYYQRDVSFSWWIETPQERTAENLKVAAERVREMGPVGLCRQFLRKTLTNYNDGTFCWGGEGVFYREILPEKDSVLSPFFRNLYYGPQEVYQGDYGKYNRLWQNGMQAVWMLTLLLCVFAAFTQKNEGTALIMLSLIGLTAFETLFEARARYLYCFLPLYIALASLGLEAVRNRYSCMKERIKD